MSPKIFFATVTLLASQACSAAAVHFDIKGNWWTPTSDDNLHITTAVDLDQPDGNAWNRIGAYASGPVLFKLQTLGPMSTPFELRSLANQSFMDIYPSAPDAPTGELHFFGQFDDAYRLPNGVAATTYDLRVTFDTISNDTLGALNADLRAVSATLYLGSQLGAWSASMNRVATTIDVPVPEPTSPACWMAACGAFVIVRVLPRHRKKGRAGLA